MYTTTSSPKKMVAVAALVAAIAFVALSAADSAHADGSVAPQKTLSLWGGRPIGGNGDGDGAPAPPPAPLATTSAPVRHRPNGKYCWAHLLAGHGYLIFSEERLSIHLDVGTHRWRNHRAPYSITDGDVIHSAVLTDVSKVTYDYAVNSVTLVLPHNVLPVVGPAVYQTLTFNAC